MNSKLIKYISLSFLFITTGAIAADDIASTVSADTESLDIKRIVSMTPVPVSCQVEPATMVYIDSQGTSHTISYKMMGTCQGGV
jgi:AAA15 family ATPase/GTPase